MWVTDVVAWDIVGADVFFDMLFCDGDAHSDGAK
jgi:hypothetical protein